MAAGAFTFYDAAKINVLSKTMNFGTSPDNYNLILTTASYSPSVPTDSTYSNVSSNEVANGNGYTTGGITLSGLSLYYTNSPTTLPTVTAGGSGYPASSTVSLTLSGGTSSTAAVFSCSTNSSGVVTTVNSVTTQGVYTVLPTNPAATTGGGGTGATLTLVWDAAFTAGSVSWTSSTITAKYAVLIHRAGGSLASTDLLVGYVDLNSGGGAISSTNATFQVSWSSIGLFTLE